MASNFISTYNLLNGPRVHARNSQAEIARLGKEIVEARHADVGLVLGAKTGHATILHQELGRIAAFTTANGLATGRLDMTDSALTEIRTEADKIMATLVGLPTNQLGAATIRGEVERTLQSVTEKLNAAYAGQQLFGGIKTDTMPVDLETGKTQVETAFANFRAAFQTYWADSGNPGVATVNDIGAREFGLFLNPVDPATLDAAVETPEFIAFARSVWGWAVSDVARGTDGPAAPPTLVQDFGNADLSRGGTLTLAVGGTHAGDSGKITFTDAADLISQLTALPGVASAVFGAAPNDNVLTIVGTAGGSTETLQFTSVDNLDPRARFDREFSDVNWRANWSSASDSNLHSQISATENIESSVNANADPFRYLTRAYSVLGALPADELNENAFKAAVDYAIRQLGEGVNGVTVLQADVGAAQARVKTVNEALATQKKLLEGNLYDLEGVDPSTAKSQLDMVELQLSLSYALTSRLQNISLLNYVR